MSNWRIPSFGALALPLLAAIALAYAVTAAARDPATATGTTTPGQGALQTRGGYASEVPDADVIKNNDGTALAADQDDTSIPVAEELDFIRDNSFRKSFEASLKTVTELEYHGTRYVGCEQYPLEIHAARPDQLRTLVKGAGSAPFEGRSSRKGAVLRGKSRGLTAEEERALLETFDFDTPIAALEKGHPLIKPLGMQKLPGMLTWKVQVERSGGPYRVLYIDSHTGDIVRFSIVHAGGARILDVKPHDYRNVEGIRVPFAVDYLDPNGNTLASDRIERVDVKRSRS